MEKLRFVAALLVIAVAGCDHGPYDVLLTGGWIVDGSGNPRWQGDVGIRGDRIVAVGYLPGARARDTVDARGLVVAPGFIDMLGQSSARSHRGSPRKSPGRAARSRRSPTSSSSTTPT